MGIHHHRQSQFELFPGESNQPVQKAKPRFLSTKITFSFENIVVIFVVFIVCMVLSYSLGIDRGSKMVMPESRQQGEVLVKEESEPSDPEPEIIEASVVPSVKTMLPSREERVSKATGEIEEIEKSTVQAVDEYFTVQVASFKQDEYAQKEAMGLKQDGYDTIVMRKGAYSIVCVGKFHRKREAQEYSKKLKSKYKDCLIRSL